MADPRDKIDSWLDADAEPLAPPPGAFSRICKRARRRKASRALASAAGAVVVIAAAVALPHAAQTLLHPLLHRGSGTVSHAVAAGASPRRTVPAPRKTHEAKGGATPETHSATIAPPAASSLSAGNSGSAAPPNFQPTSVTFINTRIGAVIGQAWRTLVIALPGTAPRWRAPPTTGPAGTGLAHRSPARPAVPPA